MIYYIDWVRERNNMELIMAIADDGEKKVNFRNCRLIVCGTVTLFLTQRLRQRRKMHLPLLKVHNVEFRGSISRNGT